METFLVIWTLHKMEMQIEVEAETEIFLIGKRHWNAEYPTVNSIYNFNSLYVCVEINKSKLKFRAKARLVN